MYTLCHAFLDTLCRAQYFSTLDLSAGFWQIPRRRQLSLLTVDLLNSTGCHLVCSCTFEEHLQHLKLVFERLRKAQLRLKVSKCVFLREQVLSTWVMQSPSKGLAQIQTRFPVPTDVHKLQQFLGLAFYYQRFIQNFAAISLPLNTLTKKSVSFQ